jgi:CRP-like cAMP-binding protein
MDFNRIIRNISHHITPDQVEIDFYTSLLTSRELGRKDFLLCAGETGKQMSFVDAGCLKVFSVSEDGTEHIVKFAPEDWWAMDIESFTLQVPSFYSIQALEPSRIWQRQDTECCRLILHKASIDHRHSA